MAGRSPSFRPTKQPASPRFEINGTAMSAAQQQRLRPSRQQSSSSRRATQASLRLPGIPRFHPANYPSAQSSMAGTPMTGMNSPQPPMSPRSQQRAYSEAQRAVLLNYQREFLNPQAVLAGGAGQHRRQLSGSGRLKPVSPRLMPLIGSPGPVTPLELEGDGYLTAGVGSGSRKERADNVERMLKQELDRMNRGSVSPGGRRIPSTPTTPVGSC